MLRFKLLLFVQYYFISFNQGTLKMFTAKFPLLTLRKVGFVINRDEQSSVITHFRLIQRDGTSKIIKFTTLPNCRTLVPYFRKRNFLKLESLRCQLFHFMTPSLSAVSVYSVINSLIRLAENAIFYIYLSRVRLLKFYINSYSTVCLKLIL